MSGHLFMIYCQFNISIRSKIKSWAVVYKLALWNTHMISLIIFLKYQPETIPFPKEININ